MFCVQRRAKTVMSMCRAQTLNCGSNFTNCQDYVGVIGISEEDVIFFTWQLLDISTFLFPNEEQRKTSPWQIANRGNIYLLQPSSDLNVEY